MRPGPWVPVKLKDQISYSQLEYKKCCFVPITSSRKAGGGCCQPDTSLIPPQYLLRMGGGGERKSSASGICEQPVLKF